MPQHRDQRRRRDVHVPENADDFEDMCVAIYRHVFGSPGARRNGRSGQRQKGRDILITDWSTRHPEVVQTVWVQCKHTGRAKAPADEICKDVRDAAALARSGEAYRDVHLFIVATSTPNDADLHDRVAALQHELPFKVEVHFWDTLCDYVRDSDRLWDQYNRFRKEDTAPGFRLDIELLTSRLRGFLERDQLKEADKLVAAWQAGTYQISPGAMKAVPADAWETDYDLRHLLLDLYSRAHDTRRAQPLLKLEVGLSTLADTGILLDYLLAERVNANLPGATTNAFLPDRGLKFSEILRDYARGIVKLRGPTDDMGCLALLLLLHTEDVEVHEKALETMRDRVRTALGTGKELEARVGHAVVRYYFVMRYGWTPSTRYHELGDTIGRGRPIDLGHELLDQPFEQNDGPGVAIRGIQPNDTRGRVSFGADIMISGLARHNGTDPRGLLPKLRRMCRVYTAYPDMPEQPTRWDSTIHEDSRSRSVLTPSSRVVDSETLFRLATSDRHQGFAKCSRLVMTELTFKLLLGHQAFLRAYTARLDQSDKDARTLRALDWLIAHCVHGSHIAEIGQIRVMPVYDDPPMRLRDWDGMRPIFSLRPFTLDDTNAERIRREQLRHGQNAERLVKLEERYRERDDEWNLACLLALSMNVPMLTFRDDARRKAAAMGVGAAHPDRHDRPVSARATWQW